MDKTLEQVDWKSKLDPEVYKITREKGTEMPFSGKYCNHKEKGKYVCSNCGEELFSSESKCESNGWPSFNKPTDKSSISTQPDDSFGMKRTEAICNKCGAHLGHVFGVEDDKKYCVNSLSLEFMSEKNDTISV